MPGAPKPTALDDVHSSCKAVLESPAAQQLGVTLDTAAVAAYAAQLQPSAVAAAEAKSGLAFPLKFDSLEAEITFLALLHLLDFGSGYDQLLRASSAKRGWRETIQYGCFGLALAAKRLDGPWMRSFSLYSLHTAFGFDSKVEQQLQPGITISKAGPLAPLAEAIHSTIVETGKALEAAGAKSLGGLILEHLDGLKAAGKPFTAASLVEELADSIPGFQDSGLFNSAPSTATAPTGATATAAAGGVGAATATGAATGAETASSGSPPIKVTYLRKAQALAAELGQRFGREDARFSWADGAKLAADSGPVLPAVLHQLGLLKLSGPLNTAAAAAASQQQEQQGQQQGQGQQQPLEVSAGSAEERVVRAAAVAAVDAIVVAAAAAGASAASSAGGASGDEQAGSGSLTAHAVSSYLLSLVKEDKSSGRLMLAQGDADAAVLRPFVCLGTTAY